jgi:hypothetical protein
MEYSWEVYKKVKDRKYGYYCLPILFHGDAVGLIEPFYRKKERTLEIRAFHLLDTTVDKARFRSALTDELLRFSSNLSAECLDVKSENRWLRTITENLL